MASSIHPPDQFMPLPSEKPRLDFWDWKAEFHVYLRAKQANVQRQINVKCLGLSAQQRATEAANIAAALPSEHDNLNELFSLLGSEGFRRYRMKTGVNPAALPQDATVEAALAVCDGIFGKKMHIGLARTKLYARKKKPKESVDDFLCALRTLSKDCGLNVAVAAADHEDLRVSEAFLTGCNDQEMLEKILNAHPDAMPTLEQIVTIAQNFEKSKNDAKATTSTDVTGLHICDDSAENSESNSESGEDILFVAKKGKGRFRNFVRQPKGRWQKAPTPANSTSANSSERGTNVAQGSATSTCFHCGKTGHNWRSKSCPAKGKICSYCSWPNHFESVCRIKKNDERQRVSVMDSLSTVSSEEASISAAHEDGKISCEVLIRPKTLNGKTSGEPKTLKFWADTGAMVSTIRESEFRANWPNAKFAPTQRAFHAYNGTHTSAIGKISVKAAFRGGVERAMSLYIVPDFCLSLLGLYQMGLLGMKIDTANRSIMSVETDSVDSASHSEVLLRQLKEAFPAAFSDSIGKMRNFEHKIRLKPDSVPVQMPFRPVPFSKVAQMSEELDRCLKDGIIERLPEGKMEWNSPVHGVNKPDGSLRVTVDYSGTINPCIIPTIHPLPRPQEIFLKARKVKFLSKLDLRKAYWHIVLSEDSRPCTAFMTKSHGLIQFTRLPMGMTDSAASFQSAIEQCLNGLEGVAQFIDDLLIWGDSKEEHDERVFAVFERLVRDGFRVTELKLILAKQQISMLGQLLTVNEGDEMTIVPDPSRNRDFFKIPPPKNLKKLQQFVGAANYFSSHIPHFASIAEPLFKLKRKRVHFHWDEDCDKAFGAIKDAIASPQVLVPFDPNCPVHLTTDASSVGLGAVLSIEINSRLRPVAFASKTMTAAERNYSTPEQEALACVWAVEKFNQFLYGRHFILHSDQSSLQTLMMSFGNNPVTGRCIQRWFHRLRHYDYTVRHIAGKDNVLADFLSRISEDSTEASPIPSIPDDDDSVTILALTDGTAISAEDLISASTTDPVITKLAQYTKTGWPKQKTISHAVIRILHTIRNEFSEWNGLVFRGQRLVVPEILQKQVLEKLHSGHPGIVRMKQLYRELYFWYRGSTECEEFVQNCVPCAASEKSSKIPQVPTGEIPPPAHPWEKVAIDITGPFWTAPTRQENIIVLMDYFSKWPEIHATSNTTAAKIIHWLEEVFAQWGNPLELVSDNGPQFTSHEFEEFLAAKSIKHTLTPVYCPERNGLVERFNRVLKSGAQVLAATGENFYRGILRILASFRATAPQNGQSPAVLARGWNIQTEADIRNPLFLAEGARLHLQRQEAMKLERRAEYVREKAKFRHYAKGNVDDKKSRYRVGEIVQHKLPKSQVRKGQSPKSRPLEIVSKIGRWDFRLSDGQIWNARKLNRYRPYRRFEQFQENGDYDLPAAPPAAPAAPPIRRSQRANFGVPPDRYSPG